LKQLEIWPVSFLIVGCMHKSQNVTKGVCQKALQFRPLSKLNVEIYIFHIDINSRSHYFISHNNKNLSSTRIVSKIYLNAEVKTEDQS